MNNSPQASENIEPRRQPTKMTAKSFQNAGYLQEVNRRFFHPLGLAMWIDPETDEMGIFDDRADPDGWQFGAPDQVGVELMRLKAAAIDAEIDQRRLARYKALGYWVQPLDEIPIMGSR